MKLRKYLKAPNNREILVIASLALLGLTAYSPIALANASIQQKMTISISSGSLENALKEASRQFNQQIVFFSDVAKGRKIESFNGSFTKDELFEKLLIGTDLEYFDVNEKTIGIGPTKAKTEGSITPKTSSTSKDKSSSLVISDNEEPVSGLEVITVTAQRRVQNLQEVPIAITSFSGDMLDRQGISQFSDLSRLSPGFTGSTFSQSEPILAIRGATNTFSQAGTSKPVGVFVDDVYISRNTASAFELYDLEQVSVLRGPQGTLFGRNVTGGALVVNTTKPSIDTTFAKMEIGLGNYGANTVKGLISSPISEDIAYKMSGSFRSQDGYGKDRLSDTEQNDINSLNLRGQLLYEPSKSFSALLTLDFNNDKNGGRTLSTSFPESADDGDIRTSEHGIDQNYERDVFGVSAHLDWKLDSGDIRSITAFRQSDSDELFSFSSTSYTLMPGISATFPYQQIANNRDKPSTFSQELRFVSDNSGGFGYVAGIYYFFDQVERQAGTTRLAGTTGNVIRNNVYDQNVDTKSVALYSDLEWQLTEQWILNLGGRYTYEEKDVQVDFIDSFNPSASFDSPNLNDNWSEFTPRVSVSWQPSKNMLLYTSFTQGFTSGGFNTEGNNNDVIGLSFKPETIDAYEFGLKSDFFSNRLRTNLSVFTQKYKDKQEGYLDKNFNFVIVNAAEANIDGMEVEASWLLNDYLTLFTNYAYLDAHYEQFSIENRDGSIDDRSGNLLATSPKNSMNIGLDLFVPLASGELSGNIGYSWQNDYFTGSENKDTFLIDSSELINAHISYETDTQWRFTVWANNLANKEYVLIRSDFGTVIGIGEHYAPPRIFGFKVSKVFE